MSRGISKAISVVTSLALAFCMVPAAAFAEGANELAGEPIGESIATLETPEVAAAENEQADDAEPAAENPAETPEAAASEAGTDATPDSAEATDAAITAAPANTPGPEADADDGPALTTQENVPEGDIAKQVGTSYPYEDTENGYFYQYTVLTIDTNTNTGTAELWDIQYLDDSYDGHSETLPEGVEEASVDFVYPSEIEGFTITKLQLTSLPSFRSVQVPASVTTLTGSNSHLGDTVETVTFDANSQVTEIPDRYFMRGGINECIPEVVLPDSIERIGKQAFAHNMFESFTLPANLKTIDEKAFEYCLSLRTVTWNDALETIGDYAFRNTMLEELNFPASLQTIGDYAFYKNYNDSWDENTQGYGEAIQFSEVVISDNVTSIGAYAFTGTTPYVDGKPQPTPIESVVLGSSVERIGTSAFQYAGITTLELPASLTSLSDEDNAYAGAFGDCVNLKAVTWSDAEQAQIETLTGFGGCTSLESIDIPINVKTIGDGAFMNCSALKSILLPPSVQTIGKQAFQQTGLTRINIPGSVEDIGELAFYKCEALAKATLNEGLQTIGENAFKLCGELTSITIPSSVERIGWGAFIGCDYGISQTGRGYFTPYEGGLESLSIKGGNTPLTIEGDAFAGCQGLYGKTIVLPARVNELAGSAFLGIDRATFKIYNPNIKLISGGTSLYLENEVPAEDIAGFSEEDVVGPYEDTGLYTLSIPDPWMQHSSYGYSNMVSNIQSHFETNINQSIVYYPDELSATTSPTFATYLKYAASDGLQSYRPTFQTFSGGEYVEPEDPEEIVEVEAAGRLLVTTTGDAGSNARVCVFDASDNLVTSVQAVNGYAVIEKLGAGNYTVAAFAKSAGFTSVANLNAFATLGLGNSDFAQAAAEIAADADTAIELSVPKVNQASEIEPLKSGSVAIAKSTVYPNIEFFATINYRMDSPTFEAERITISLPKNVTVTSVASATKNYGTSGYNASTHTLTITPAGADKESGRIWVGMKAASAGALSVGVSVYSSGTTKVVGNASTTCEAITLDLPEGEVQDRIFEVGIHSAPSTQVTLRSAGTEQTITTNKNGFYRATIDLTEVETTLPYTMVVASAAPNDIAATASGMVNIAAQTSDPYTLKEFSFVHAGKQYYLVRHGKVDHSYYTYIANGVEANKHWTFSAVYASQAPLYIGNELTTVIQTASCELQVQMLDGSSRFETMPIIRSVKQDDGTYLNYFGCSLYLEQAGDHVFPTSLVPCAFDVTLDTPYEVPEQTEADMQIFRDQTYRPLENWKSDMGRKSKLIREAQGYEDVNVNFDDLFFVFTYYETVYSEMREEVRDNPNITQEQFEQLDQYLTEFSELANEAAAVLDAIMGFSVPASECTDTADWVGKNFEYESDADFSAEFLKEHGYNITTDTQAAGSPGSTGGASEGGSPGNTGGTPVGGLKSGKLAEPEQVATKSNKGPDGQVQSISYQDSNGNKATIPIEKMRDFGVDKAETAPDVDFDWLTPGDGLALGSGTTPIDEAIAFLDDIDDACGTNFGSYGSGVKDSMNVLSYAYNQTDRINQSEELANFYNDAAEARGNVENLEIHLNYHRMHGDTTSKCYKALKNERDWAIIVADGKLTDRDWHIVEFIRAEEVDFANSIFGPMTDGASTIPMYAVDKITGKAVNNEMNANRRVLNPALQKLNAAHLQRLKDCGEEEGHPKFPKNVILDPSGTVYEAFPANTVEGVTATIYEVTEGSIGDPWEAEAYDQENPQVTSTSGFFGWDVPSGEWKVAFAKDGYEDTATDALQVPPPRIGLQIPLTTKADPAITNTSADTKSIEVSFNQYMDASTIYGATVDGQAVDPSTIEWAEETDGSGALEQGFSQMLRIPAPTGAKDGDSLQVQLDGAKSYTGKELGQKSFNVTVAPRPTTIEFNFDETISLQAGTERPTTVRVYDGAGNPMEGLKLNASIDNELLATVDATGATTDADGAAKLQLSALLPGMSMLTVSVEGTSLTRSIKLLTTADANTVARPTAKLGATSIGAGAAAESTVTVDAGTKLELACATEGATIYYTTNGNCPCQNMAGRQAYTGPIEVTADTDFIIAAYLDGMDYSEKLRIHVKVKPLDLSKATVTLSPAKYTYDGTAKKPTPTVTLNGKAIAAANYAVAYTGNVNAGTATAVITGQGACSGIAKATFTIAKAKQTITVAKNECVKGKKVKLGAKASGKGKLTYKSKNKKIASVNKKGVVKGVKAGKAKITITAKATANYLKASKTITVKVGKKNTLTAKRAASKVSVAFAKVSKKKQTLASNIKVAKAQGKVTYANASSNATAKKFTVNKKTGKITVPKGTAKGSYAVKVKVTAKGNSKYISGTKTVKFTLQVK